VIAHVAAAALASRLGKVVVVLGHQKEALRAALADLDGDARLRFVDNADYADGQSSSVRAGLRAIGSGARGAMFLMGDQPLLGPGIIDRLIGAFEASDKGICLPAQGGRRRNPVIFAARYFPEILAISGDTGARGLIEANPSDVEACAIEDEAAFRDIDHGSDLAALEKSAGGTA
jgi:molybdenum cofactor cytidylyltransferase